MNRLLLLEVCVADHCLQAGLVGEGYHLARDSILNLPVSGFCI